MSAVLPAQLDPWQAVAREAAFAGSVALADLPRLREVLVGAALDAAAPATYEIAFRRDEAGRPVVLGSVRALLPLECQRCLGVMEHSVDARIRLMLTQGPNLAEPPEPYEALPVTDDRVRPAELIEDELLLSLPQIPMHPVGVCRTALQTSVPRGAEDDEVDADRPKPFAVLAGWKADP
jgi:DUF177 domain-containing protein